MNDTLTDEQWVKANGYPESEVIEMQNGSWRVAESKGKYWKWLGDGRDVESAWYAAKLGVLLDARKRLAPTPEPTMSDEEWVKQNGYPDAICSPHHLLTFWIFSEKWKEQFGTTLGYAASIEGAWFDARRRIARCCLERVERLAPQEERGEGNEGTVNNPIEAEGSIVEIAARVKRGQWTTLDLDALSNYILDEPSTPAPEQGLITEVDYAVAERLLFTLRETGVSERNVSGMLAATLCAQERKKARLEARVRELEAQVKTLEGK